LFVRCQDLTPFHSGVIYSLMDLGYFIFLAAYLVILLVVGLVFRKRMNSLEDFFLASRDLSGLWIFLTLVASWIGATSLLVSVDEAYREGVSSFWVMGVPALITVLLFFLFFARPIRKLTIVTLPDLVELRYGRTVRHLASLLIVWYMVLLASSQMVALGNFLRVFLHTSYFSCLAIGTAAVLIYSILGGFFSVVFTDGLQFFFLFGGISGLCIYLLRSSAFHDISRMIQISGRLDYLSFFAHFKTNSLIAISFVLAWVVSPIVWQRIQAARSLKSARQGLIAASITLFLVYGIIVGIGILSLPLLAISKTGGPVLSAIIASKTGKILGGVLFVAVVAAIMSTMDTGVNTGAMSMTHDIYFQLFPHKRDEHVLLVSRISTFIVAALAFLVATQFQSILKTLGLASEIMAVGFFVPGISMLFLKKKWPSAGFLSLVSGGGYALIGFFCEVGILAFPWPAWPFSIPKGLALSSAGFLLGMLFDKIMRTSH
jgi:SSS family solute:Na+ symporter